MPHEDIPVIETERLVLHGPAPEDYPKFAGMFGSRHSRFLGGPLTEYETWMLYAAEIGHWRIRGFGMWVIADKSSGDSLGMTGGWFPEGYPTPELAWMIWPSAQGRGAGLEATMAARRWLYETQGWNGAVSFLDPKNYKATDLAKRLGATLDEDTKAPDSREIVFRHPDRAGLDAADAAARALLQPVWEKEGIA